MPRELRLPKDLQLEQLEVLNKATVPNPNEFILVQGVAGSGKTTIALNIARKVGELNASRPPASRQTILFLTYNDRLAEYCRNTLANISAITKIIASDKNQLQDGSISVMTVSDLFRLSFPLQGKSRFLSDEDCIKYITNIGAQRGIRDLLPTQIFSLIATFLRGRPELIDRTIDELNAIIDRDIRRSAHYRMYGESLQEIRRRLLKTYEDWKRASKGLDRSDVAKLLRDQILGFEEHLGALPELDAEYLRKISRRKLGDGDPKIFQHLNWMGQVFGTLQNIPKIEQTAILYSDILGSASVKQDKLKGMCDSIYSSIPEFGLRCTSIWEPICSHLRNPLIIVDEIQDLSPVECENLVSIWFQLARTHESHLVMLGDLNQQITPSGFEWGTLRDLIEEKAEIYQQQIDPPFIPDLSYNYRTTEEIARFVHSIMSQIAPNALADEEIANRFLRYSINPSTTLPINLEDKIEQIKKEEGDLVPHILVGSKELFRDGLNKYVDTLKAQEDPLELKDKLLSTVIITEHGNQVDDLISKDLNKYVIENDLIEVIPVLSCKGLEFDRCVLHGLSIKNIGEIEQDLISRWYTSFTRAKLQLLIYLTEQEFDFIQKLGWNKVSADVALVKKVTVPETIVDELVRLGKTDLDDDARYSIGEASLSRFIQTGNEEWLQKSLRLLKQGDLADRFVQAAWQGAEWFEKQKNYLKAAEYYREARDSVDEVRVLALHQKVLENEGLDPSTIKQCLARAEKVATSELDFEKQAKCWLLLQEYDKALNAASQGGDKHLQQEIASQVAESIKTLANEQPDHARFYAELLQENGYLDAAALSWLSLSEWNAAFDCVNQSEKSRRDVVARQAATLALDLTKKRVDDAIAIASLLDENKYFEEASLIWLQLRMISPAIQSLVNAGYLERAETTLNNLEYKVGVIEKSQAHVILGKGFSRDMQHWPKAYYYFDLAHENNECRRLEQLCRNVEDFRTLANCFSEIRDFEKIVKLANELELLGNNKKELIAECWEMAEEGEHAASAWMQLFFEHIERLNQLLGPKPDKNLPHPSSRQRFERNIEQNLSNYNLQLTDWEALSHYTSNPREFHDNMSKIVSIISSSEKWQEEMTDFWRVLRERAKSASKSGSDFASKMKLPSKGESIRPDEVATLWERFDVVNDVFQQRAVEVSRDCFKKGDKLLAIRIMNSTCKWQNEAEKMSNELFRIDLDLWIKSWKMLEYTNENIERKIFNLHPLDDAEIIRKAIFETYQDNDERKALLWEKYRNKLVNHKNKRAQEILSRYFPDYDPPKPITENPLPLEQAHLTDLIKDIVNGLPEWSLHESDRDELSEQLGSMLEMIERKDRLSAKWKMAKAIMPDTLKADVKIKIERLDELLKKAQGSNTQAMQDTPAVENTLRNIQNPPINIGEKSKTRPRHRSRSSRQKRILQCLNLHEYSLVDAMREFESTLNLYDDDNTIGALLINHGYGKDKGISVIKEWIRNRTKDLSRNKHVRQIINGEEIVDPFDKNASTIRQAVDGLDFSDIGANNAGITVIIFDRR